MDPDPGGQKTCGSGSGNATLKNQSNFYHFRSNIFFKLTFLLFCARRLLLSPYLERLCEILHSCTALALALNVGLDDADKLGERLPPPLPVHHVHHVLAVKTRQYLEKKVIITRAFIKKRGFHVEPISIKTPNPKCRLFLKIDQ
jgi:hypothetical protein